ncbi:hypothetical protein [Aquimarina aggregata]|uniref:hypothetical protein n=1 Tax=Aquimarina aggregata TaxID=1642818 RepID=UPI00248FB0A3|nr:hypothetical protein [Aquimarina aggregata]
MKTVVKILFFIVSPVVFSQFSREMAEPTGKVAELLRYNGSIYSNEKYSEARIIDEKSGTYYVNLRHNVYSDVLEYKEGPKSYEVIKNSSIYAYIDSEEYRYCNFKTHKGQLRHGYYTPIDKTDTYSVYKKHDLKITEPKEKDPMTGSSMTSGKIKLETIFFLEQDGIIVSLPTNKKEILITFQDKSDELKEFIKKEKLRLKKEEDLIKLVKHYSILKNNTANQPQNLLNNRVQNN